MNDLDFIEYTKKQGTEKILGKAEGHTLLNFWQWAYSDLVGNTERGILAEYLVALACGINEYNRVGWDAYDLEMIEKDIHIKIEVKSSAYLQTWKQKGHTKPRFGISESLAWDYKQNILGKEKTRHADVYVFAFLAHEYKSSLNPLDLNQWQFYVLATKQLSEYARSQKTISLKSLQSLTVSVAFNNLKNEIVYKQTLNILPSL